MDQVSPLRDALAIDCVDGNHEFDQLENGQKMSMDNGQKNRVLRYTIQLFLIYYKNKK